MRTSERESCESESTERELIERENETNERELEREASEREMNERELERETNECELEREHTGFKRMYEQMRWVYRILVRCAGWSWNRVSAEWIGRIMNSFRAEWREEWAKVPEENEKRYLERIKVYALIIARKCEILRIRPLED
jgi:hypothetical protein